MKDLLSIITVVLNDKHHIENTIKSVIEQTYPNIEFIIIDGGSTDGTLEIIKQYSDDVNILISERDLGIYDAMNKGLEVGSGDYFMFLNSGDLINSEETMEKVFKNKEADFYYGETLLYDGKKDLGFRSEMTTRKLPEGLKPTDLQKGMVISHQSIIIHKSITSKFDISYKCSSDIDWVIRSLNKAQHTINTHLVISKYMVGGYSIKNKKICLTERFLIFKKHFGLIKSITSHIYIAVRYLWHKLKFKRNY